MATASFGRCYVYGAMAYGLARKAPTMWNGTVRVNDCNKGGNNDGNSDPVRRPMLVGERMQVASLVVGLAPMFGMAWLFDDVIRVEIALCGHDMRLYGRPLPETLWEHVLV
jgi:hypothetical protein